MPSRAPSYYHWSMDKPSTTNQVYGFELKDSLVEVKPRKQLGPFDYTRPFSNTGFFPQISASSSHVKATAKSLDPLSARSGRQPSAAGDQVWMPDNRFNINRGYTAGYVPIKERLVHSSVPVGKLLDRSKSAPISTYDYKKPRAEELYLWHTLSGSLVHVKNYPAEATY
ncbi:hypothetical protein LSH36_118g04022 [Paralvinella palmiformis]|uniref:Uncharacterized protein n=1 Tax=Paralvinella palmiformis TaxID=53620 RepID=A0AAD9JZJ7_9ANNE|nr:hypothetical protein LSH36_118g04022 [Paralvinella palmiformis]